MDGADNLSCVPHIFKKNLLLQANLKLSRQYHVQSLIHEKRAIGSFHSDFFWQRQHCVQQGLFCPLLATLITRCYHHTIYCPNCPRPFTLCKMQFQSQLPTAFEALGSATSEPADSSPNSAGNSLSERPKETGLSFVLDPTGDDNEETKNSTFFRAQKDKEIRCLHELPARMRGKTVAAVEPILRKARQHLQSYCNNAKGEFEAESREQGVDEMIIVSQVKVRSDSWRRRLLQTDWDWMLTDDDSFEALLVRAKASHSRHFWWNVGMTLSESSEVIETKSSVHEVCITQKFQNAQKADSDDPPGTHRSRG